jgi:hypothetical protein
MSVYDMLRDKLQQCGLETVRMSFAKMESLLGRSLPISAHRREWWTNEEVQSTRHVQCRSWQSAGYDAEVNLPKRTVTFRRKKSLVVVPTVVENLKNR